MTNMPILTKLVPAFGVLTIVVLILAAVGTFAGARKPVSPAAHLTWAAQQCYASIEQSFRGTGLPQAWVDQFALRDARNSERWGAC